MRIIVLTFVLLMPFDQKDASPVGGMNPFAEDSVINRCNPKIYRC